MNHTGSIFQRNHSTCVLARATAPYWPVVLAPVERAT